MLICPESHNCKESDIHTFCDHVFPHERNISCNKGSCQLMVSSDCSCIQTDIVIEEFIKEDEMTI